MILRALLALLLVILSSCFGMQMNGEPDVSEPGGAEPVGQRVDHIIQSVDVSVMESYPMQLSLHVIGSQPDGCMVDVQVDQRREGNDVFVEIYRVIPPDMACPEMIMNYETRIRVKGGFERGSYTIHVNDYVVEITI
jgi:inhibitor of cysteine peptidase